MSANEGQVGGGHYKKLKIQHWDYVEANGIPYLEACAIKYLTRWRDKGGVQDLHKAIHYIEKRIELEEGKPNPAPVAVLPKPKAPRPGTILYRADDEKYKFEYDYGLTQPFVCPCPVEQQTLIQSVTGNVTECNLCGKKVAVS